MERTKIRYMKTDLKKKLEREGKDEHVQKL